MVLNLASILVALAIAGLLSGCSSSPPTPTLSPVTPLSGEERDEVIKRLNETLAANSLAQLKPTSPARFAPTTSRPTGTSTKSLTPSLNRARMTPMLGEITTITSR